MIGEVHALLNVHAKCSDGEEGMEPGSSVSRFRHYVGAVSGWQCSDEEGGSLRVLPTSELLVLLLCCLFTSGIARLNGSIAVSAGPPAVRWLA